MVLYNYEPSRSQWPRGLRHRCTAARLLRSWVRIPPGHRCLSVVGVVCCQVEVSATSWSLVQSSPTDCDASCSVWSTNLKNEEAMARVGPQRHREKNNYEPNLLLYGHNTDSHNKSQLDTLFLKFILVKNSTCLGQTYCPSSLVLILCSQQ